MDQPNQTNTQNLDALMEFDLSCLDTSLNTPQKEALEQKHWESAFKKLVAAEEIPVSDMETLKTDLKKIPDLKVKFLAHLASMKEDYIQVLLSLMKLRHDPKYSPALLTAANNRDWPTLAHLCQT